MWGGDVSNLEGTQDSSLPHSSVSYWTPKPGGCETSSSPSPEHCNPCENEKLCHQETPSKDDAIPFEKHFLEVTTVRRTSGLRVILWVTTVPTLSRHPVGSQNVSAAGQWRELGQQMAGTERSPACESRKVSCSHRKAWSVEYPQDIRKTGPQLWKNHSLRTLPKIQS